MTAVSVVVPYFEQQARLDLLLTALALQVFRDFDVVVADDGSRTPPEVGVRPYPVQVVRQEDRGVRPAAARNLGAAACAGELLCFLDGDTFPEPGYLLATVALSDRWPRAVLTGRRRHADLTGWTPDRLRSWFTGGPAPRELPEPRWLADAYDRTHDLRDAGEDGYRYVVGAVQSLRRDLFDEVGGWEGEIDVYGGEDWELAHRCWLAGADLAHVRDAVAWHDGPDLPGRGDLVRLKNLETTALARFVTDPGIRGRGLVYLRPDVVVELDDRGFTEADVAVCVASLLRDTDARVWLRDGAAAGPRGPLAEDPRVHVGPVPHDLLARCRFRVAVGHPLLLPTGTTLRALTDRAPVDGDGLVVRRARDLARGARPEPVRVVTTPLEGAQLEAVWGRS